MYNVCFLFLLFFFVVSAPFWNSYMNNRFWEVDIGYIIKCIIQVSKWNTLIAEIHLIFHYFSNLPNLKLANILIFFNKECLSQCYCKLKEVLEELSLKVFFQKKFIAQIKVWNSWNCPLCQQEMFLKVWYKWVIN